MKRELADKVATAIVYFMAGAGCIYGLVVGAALVKAAWRYLTTGAI